MTETLMLAALVAATLMPQIAGAASTPPLQADVVVYGGTPGGVASALAAARGGARTVLLEQTRHVGGLSTSGVNTSEIEHMIESTYGGIALEFYRRMGKHYGFDLPAYRWESHVAEQTFLAMLKEAGVEVRYGVFIDGVTLENRRITRMALSDGTSLAGKVFIDATYEGDLMAMAKVSYTWGRESIDTYEESYAGIRLQDKDIDASPYDDAGRLLPGFVPLEGLTAGAGDKKVMNYNFRLTVSRAADRVAWPKPEGYDPARYIILARFLKNRPGTKLKDLIDLYPFPSGKYHRNANERLDCVSTDKWEMNNKQNAIISLGHFGGQFDYPDADRKARQRIYQDHKAYTQGLLYFLAHDEAVPETLRRETQSWGLAADEYKDNGNWPYYLYVREARRMQGAYVMTEHDVLTRRAKDDAIAVGSHWIDSHHVQRVATSKTTFRNEGRIWHATKEPFALPYRCITPKAEECANLLVPVAVSASHVAFCAIRLESTWMMLGHAAGAAAARCASDGKPVQEIDVLALQRQLRQEKQVVDLP